VSAVLEVRGLSVDFDGFRALDGVDLTVEAGEVRFLIGPNGAGKTTLVDCISGLTNATSGTVHFYGRDITSGKEHRLVRMGIGRSFQTPTVFESLTVVENLDLAESFRKRLVSLLRRRKTVSEGVAETLERVKLQGPKLLLLDELVAGMSLQERLDTGALLQELAGERTIMVIEHDMAFLRRFASAVTVLHEGRILSEGTVEEVQADEKVREVYLGRSRDERSGGAAAPSVAAASGSSASGASASEVPA
jgi:urea transport system ATP-binding protein